MTLAPGGESYEYRQADTLDDVNRLAEEEGFDLFQAVAVGDAVRFVLRRVRDRDQGRRVGFANPGGREETP